MKKMLISLTFSMLSISCCNAQSVVPSSYNLQVAPDELNIIAEALQEQPYKKVFMLMSKLRQQVVEQQQPKPVPAPATPQEPAKPADKPDASPQAN